MQIRKAVFLFRDTNAVLIAMVGIMLTMVIWLLLLQDEHKVRSARFEMLARERGLAIERELAADIELLHSIRAFYAGSSHVDRHEFSVFAHPLLERHKSVLALEYVPRIGHTNRPQFERELGEISGASNSILQLGEKGLLETAGHREFYYPVHYHVQPSASHNSALGFDYGSDPRRRLALAMACDSGRTIASQAISLFDSAEGGATVRSGLFVAIPIYQNGVVSRTPAERRAHLQGFVVGLFRLADIVDRAFDDLAPANIDLMIADQTIGNDPSVLMIRHAETNLQPDGKLQQSFDSSQLTFSNPIDFAERHWDVQFKPTAEFFEEHKSWTPFLALLSGWFISGLLAWVVHLMSIRAEKVRQLVEKRTRELQEANQKLETEVGERKAAEARLAAQAISMEHKNAELEQARRELDQTVTELAEKNRELDEFTYVASHDLQEPVRKLISFSKLLRQDAGDDLGPEAQKDLDFICDAAFRMRQLVQDLLTLSRAGRSALSREPVSLDECIDMALSALQIRIEEVEATFDRDDMPTVIGDCTTLTQLFQNLISNALKFVGDRPPHVKLTCRRQGDYWVVGVQDNGIGMKPEYCQRIFEPFQRLHGRGEYEGSGIGLSICKKTVTRHGGEIWVESEPGQGSHFQMTLPAQMEAETPCNHNPITASALSSC